VQRIHPQNSTIELACAGAGCGHYWPPQPGLPFYAVDLLEELDTEGEWWLDRSSGELFVWPPARESGKASASSVAPAPVGVEVSVCCQDQARLHKGDCSWFGGRLIGLVNVSHFTLDAVRIDHVRGNGVSCENCTNVTLSRLTVKWTTTTAVTVSGGKGVTVQRCNISDVGEGGVILSGGNRATLERADHTLVDSEIHSFQRWHFTENAAVEQIGVGTTAAHNHIHEGRHYAFCPSGNDHTIDANLVHDVLTECWDAGAIDNGRDVTWRGNVASNNIFHSIGRPDQYPCAAHLYPNLKTERACIQTAMYFDDHFSGWTVFRNVIARVQVGAFVHFGRENNFTNNVFLDVGIALAIEGGGQFDALHLLPGIKAAESFPAWPQYLKKYDGLRTMMELPTGFKCSYCAPYNNTLERNLAAGYTGNSSIWDIKGGWLKATTVNSSELRLPLLNNWNSSDVSAAGFVQRDPIKCLDFRLKTSSAARSALGGVWTDIPLAPGPRLRAPLDAEQIASAGTTDGEARNRHSHLFGVQPSTSPFRLGGDQPQPMPTVRDDDDDDDDEDKVWLVGKASDADSPARIKSDDWSGGAVSQPETFGFVDCKMTRAPDMLDCLAARARGPCQCGVLSSWKSDDDAVSPTINIAHSSPPSPSPLPETDWFARAKFGVFTHFLDSLQNSFGSNSQGRNSTWDECVSQFDVEAYAESAANTGAKFAVVTLMQMQPFMIAPNAVYDKLAGFAPGQACSRRDLVRDVHAALSRRGLKLLLYFTGDGPCGDKRAQTKLGWGSYRHGVQQVPERFVQNWAAVLREYAVRYGDKVSGWWLDGMYREYYKYNEALLEKYTEAIRAGNPKALVAFNTFGCPPAVDSWPGGCPPIGDETIDPTSEFADFTAGEADSFKQLPANRFVNGTNGSVAQWHSLHYLGSQWAAPGSCQCTDAKGVPALMDNCSCAGCVPHTAAELRRYSEAAAKQGGVVTVDVQLLRNGSMNADQAAILAAAWKPQSNALLMAKTDDSASSGKSSVAAAGAVSTTTAIPLKRSHNIEPKPSIDMSGRRVAKPGEFRVSTADAKSNKPMSLKVLDVPTTLMDYVGNESGSITHKTDDDPAQPVHERWVDAVSGSDRADGSKASPLRSLAAAAARMRQLKVAGGSVAAAGIVHVAATDVYAPLHLDVNDSNTAWRCHGGSLCEVSAGAHPGNSSAHWTTSTDARLPADARGSVLEITLDPAQVALLAPSTANHGGPGGGHMPTDPHTSLYFKGKQMQLARYPNLGLSAFQAGPATNWSIVPSAGVGECFNWTDDRPTRWAAAAARGDLVLHGMFFVQWKDTYVANVSVDLHNWQLCHQGGFPPYGVARGGVWFAFNLIEELDSPGEFVLDQQASKLYFWPPTSFDPTEVLLSNATSVLSLANGTANVSIQGFAFRHSRGAGVAAVGPERLELDRCEVTDTGGEGVSIGADPGTDVRYSEPLGSSHRVTNTTISRTGLAGIVVSCGRRQTLEPCNALISDNHISNFARWGLTYNAGIALAGVGVIAAHNRVEQGPHLGLSAAGNDHVFSRNVVSDVCLQTWDTGALYVGGDWSHYNNSAIENLFFNVGRPGVHCNSPITSCERHHIYIDEWGSGWNIIGNVFVGALSHTSFYFSHCGRDNLLRNNIFINSTSGGLVALIEGDSGLRPSINSTLFAELYNMPFQTPPWSTRYPRLAQLPYNQPALPKGNEVACNVAVDQSGMPRTCFGTGMPHNSPNACINKDGYLTLQVEFYNDSSCFNVSGPSLATNESASTVFVSPNPQETFDFRLLPSAHQKLPCFTPFPTDVGPRTVANGSGVLKTYDAAQRRLQPVARSCPHCAAPVHSWATLPVSFHSSEILTNQRGEFTEAELATIAQFPLVTIEKWMGSGATDQDGDPVFIWEETAMVNAAKQVKAARPTATVIAWLDSTQVYTGWVWPPNVTSCQHCLFSPADNQLINHTYNHDVYAVQGHSQTAEYMESHPELLLRNTSGKPALGWGGLHVYDHRQQKVRDLWRDNCLRLTASGVIDGCGADFSDGAKATGLGPAVAAEWASGHEAMLRETTAALGPQGLLIGKSFDQLGDTVNAILREGCTASNQTVNAFRNISAFSRASGKRYVVQCHFGHPEYTTPLNLTAADNTAAAFLCGAGTDHYFVTGGWRAKAVDRRVAGDDGNFSTHWLPSIMGHPLGAPLADAAYDAITGVWTRRFASGTLVRFNARSNTGNIAWSDAPPPSPPPSPSPLVAPRMPIFSWARLPVFYHSANCSGLFNASSLATIAKYPLVTFEKYQGPFDSSEFRSGLVYEEDNILAASAALKRMNPNVSVLMYTHRRTYPFYRASHELEARPDWWLQLNGKAAPPVKWFSLNCSTSGGGQAAAAAATAAPTTPKYTILKDTSLLLGTTGATRRYFDR
jgi:hypothetical protein